MRVGVGEQRLLEAKNDGRSVGEQFPDCWHTTGDNDETLFSPAITQPGSNCLILERRLLRCPDAQINHLVYLLISTYHTLPDLIVLTEEILPICQLLGLDCLDDRGCKGSGRCSAFSAVFW